MAAQPNRDATLIWRKSSASGGDGTCAEVTQSGSFVLVRDSRDRCSDRVRVWCGQNSQAFDLAETTPRSLVTNNCGQPHEPGHNNALRGVKMILALCRQSKWTMEDVGQTSSPAG